MTDESAEEQLRAHVRTALDGAGISQAEAARQLGVSTKHLCQMLTGRATLTLTWAEGLLGLCGMQLVIGVRPDTQPHA
ncbi:helix-turn-helix domain-containing protein [Streptomyces sp. NPDC001276]|uniref:helix-turn-helix domain-containing protein n=1 Tax=Streptomyces sp. NPDC001276 TaxID=3364555 RepID=UPI00368912D9